MQFPPPEDVFCPTLPVVHVVRKFEVTPQTSSPLNLSLAGTGTPNLRLVLFPISTVAAAQWLPMPWPTPEPCTISVQGRYVPPSAFPRSITRSSATRTLSPVDISELAGVDSAAGGKVSIVITSESKSWTAVVAVCWCRVVPLQHVVEEAVRIAKATTKLISAAGKEAASEPAPIDKTSSSSSSSSDVDLDAGWASDCEEDVPTTTVVAGGKEEEVCEAVEVSLRCPLSYMKMAVPGRGVECCHDAAFDIPTYVAQGVATSTWNCPVCNGAAPWSRLVLCPRLAAVLEALADVDAATCDRVKMFGDGRWERVADRAAAEGRVNVRKRTRGPSPPAQPIDADAEVVDVDSD